MEAVIAAIRAVSHKLGTPLASLSENERMNDPRWIAYRNIGYFEDNRERMNYPEYRAQGLPIGSGVVESACKHVVANRCKRTGMRWDEAGAETSSRYAAGTSTGAGTKSGAARMPPSRPNTNTYSPAPVRPSMPRGTRI